MPRIISLVTIAVLGLALTAPCWAADSTVKSDAKKVAAAGREVGKEIGKGATKLGKAVAKTAKQGAVAVKEEAKKIKRTLAEE